MYSTTTFAVLGLVALLRGELAAGDTIRPTGGDRLVLVVLALANWLLDVACLASVCAAAGLGLGPHTVLLGYVAGKIAATVAVIPGGLGVTELGMAATFVAAGATGTMAAAVVALYRLISYWAVLAVGWIAWLLLRDAVQARLAAAGRWLLGVAGCGDGKTGMRSAGVRLRALGNGRQPQPDERVDQPGRRVVPARPGRGRLRRGRARVLRTRA
nr:YbhN family protein [Microbispora hainanensis]